MGLPHFKDAITHSRHSEPSSTTKTTYSSSVSSGSRHNFSVMTKKTFGIMSGHKKLSSFHFIFPHDDDTTLKNISGIYDDVLEFLRPGAYSESVTRAAWTLLIPQIESHKTYHLTQALAKMPFAEMQTFLHTLTDKCITDVENSYDSLQEKGKSTTLSSSSKAVVALTPVLKFVTQIATQSDLACLTVLEAGILDILLRIYVIFPALSSSLPEDFGRKSTLMDACQLTVVVLCRLLEKPQTVYNHPVCILWTDRDSKRPDNPLQNRCGAWRRVPRSCALRRLVVIYTGSLWKSNSDIIGGLEACMDIIEFTNSEHYGSDIVDMAFLTLLKQIVLCGETQHLLNVLAEGSREDTVRVFSGINRLWLEFIARQVSSDTVARTAEDTEWVATPAEYIYFPKPLVITHQTFKYYDKIKQNLLHKIKEVDIALYRIIWFATQAAKQNTTVRLGMLDAGTLVLVLTAFASHDFKLAGLVSMPEQGGQAKGAESRDREGTVAKASSSLPISVYAMNAGASTLLVSMRYATFREFWGEKRFNVRLSLCSSLVGNLLGGDKDEGGSRETRSLFKEIVGL